MPNDTPPTAILLLLLLLLYIPKLFSQTNNMPNPNK
jgi:hypothetical protein